MERQREEKIKAFNDLLGPPDSTCGLGYDPKYKECWGYWKMPYGFCKARRMRDGRYDPYSFIQYTQKEIDAIRHCMRNGKDRTNPKPTKDVI